MAFVGGYSGVGKSALVAELVRQVQKQKTEHQHHHHHGGSAGDNNNVFCAHGKYCELQSASVPFSAISDSLGQLAAELTTSTTTKPDDHNDGELLKEIRHKLCLCGNDGGDQLEQVMRITFPSISPLFRSTDDKKSTKGASSVVVSPNMNE